MIKISETLVSITRSKLDGIERMNTRVIIIFSFLCPPLALLLLKKPMLALISFILILASLLLAQIYHSLNNWPFPFWTFPLQLFVHFASAWYTRKLYTQGQINCDPMKIIKIYISTLSLILVFYVLLRGYIVSSYAIGSVSMNPALIHGDLVLTQKFSAIETNWFQDQFQSLTFDYGDIVIFKHPAEDEIYVKRIIAKAGDKISFNENAIFINDRQLKQDFFKSSTDMPFRWLKNELYYEYNHDKTYIISKTGEPVQINGDITIPPNNVFVMGDNRNQSIDSRFWGLLPVQNILEKPLFIWWSIQPGMMPQIRWQRIGNWLN